MRDGTLFILTGSRAGTPTSQVGVTCGDPADLAREPAQVVGMPSDLTVACAARVPAREHARRLVEQTLCAMGICQSGTFPQLPLPDAEALVEAVAQEINCNVGSASRGKGDALLASISGAAGPRIRDQLILLVQVDTRP